MTTGSPAKETLDPIEQASIDELRALQLQRLCESVRRVLQLAAA